MPAARATHLLTSAVLAVALLPYAARAQTVEEFYRGKTITVIFTGAQGSIYDVSARILMRHMANHIPGNPSVITKAMTGGGHVIGTNWLFNVAPQDGTALGSIGEAIPITQVLEPQNIKFDVAKFHWLGNPSVANLVLSTWADKGVKTIEDAKRQQVVIGAGGPTSPSGQIPRALNKIVGTKFKIVVGFPSTQIDLAMERGEVDGRGSALWVWWKTGRPDWVAGNKLNHLVQWGPKRDPELPNVPLLTDLAKNDAERQIFALLSSTVTVGRPLVAPPGVPADRVAALRAAFAKTMADPAYLEEAKKAKLDINPILADDLQRIVEGVAKTPAEVVALAKAAITEGEVFDCKALVKDKAACDEPAAGDKKGG